MNQIFAGTKASSCIILLQQKEQTHITQTILTQRIMTTRNNDGNNHKIIQKTKTKNHTEKHKVIMLMNQIDLRTKACGCMPQT